MSMERKLLQRNELHSFACSQMLAASIVAMDPRRPRAPGSRQAAARPTAVLCAPNPVHLSGNTLSAANSPSLVFGMQVQIDDKIPLMPNESRCLSTCPTSVVVRYRACSEHSNRTKMVAYCNETNGATAAQGAK